MQIIILTSQSDTFWDLAKQSRKSRPRLNQSDPGSLGIHCRSLGISLPSELDTEKFESWTGPVEKVLAGPVIEVTNFSKLLTSRGHNVTIWYLSSGNGWIQEKSDYHPQWTNNLDWQCAELPTELTESLADSDAVIAAFPSSILVGNRSLRSALGSHTKVALASGGMAQDLVTLSNDGLRILTLGVARIGSDNRNNISNWLRPKNTRN